ncbi:MAG: 3-hydroxyacyl-CoA dehydrogenase NAD-binding domain-containing protein [Candidatus Limnocylindrales bacterium]
MGQSIIGVVGAGTMGAGIAQLALENGHEVFLHDVDEAAIGRGRARIRDGLARRAARLELDADSIDEWVAGRLTGLRDAHTLDAVGTEAEIVIEAALEDLDLKRAIFQALDAASGPEVILATNTSALSVGSIAAATTRPERVIGLHFFNPAPVMALVEIVAAERTDPSVVERATTLVTAWDKTPVRCADSPGFIVNRVNRPYTLEALRMLEAGVASVEAIDAALGEGGFPLGPFELIDLTGVDINLAASRAIWDGLGRPDRLRPSVLLERLIADGRLGRKTGRGFYAYDDGRRGAVDPAFAGQATIIESAEIRARILAAIDEEARLAVGEGVATANDIDLAMRLGAGHPSGPFKRAAAPTIEP